MVTEVPRIPDEAARLEALEQLSILDTPPEAAFDDLTALAAHICQAPMSVISLVASDRQWFKSRYGVGLQETSREISFCGHAIAQPDLLVVPDALNDARFAHSPLVLEEPKIRFYAGVPLILREGHAVGTLCVMDYRPRELTTEHRQALRALSRHVIGQLELRRALAQERRLREELDQAHEHLERRVRERTEKLAVLNDELVREIGARERTQTALRESEKRYRELFENAIYGMYRVTLDGRFLDVNPALVVMLGYGSKEELLAVHSTIAIFVDPQERGRLIEELCHQHNFKNIESNWRRKDGAPIWVRLSGRTLRESSSDVTGFEVIVEDITEHRRLQEQFLQSQKMEAIGRLAGGIAHDFNNLLGVIRGYTELLLREAPPAEQSSKRIRAIDQAVERAATLTRQLLAFSRRQILAPRVFDLNQIVADMDEMFRRLIGEHIELITGFAPQACPVKADPRQIEQVLLNLVVNARDAMPEGGKLMVETSTVELDEESARAYSDAAPANYVLIAVTDTGSGMEPEILAHIFEPFFTTKPEEKGTGLGLATAYGIVKQSGGFISVHSAPGRGTRFEIFLPLVEERVERVERVRSSIYPGLRGSEALLLVEDSEALRELVSSALRELGYTVIEAKDGQAALDLSSSYRGPIDLLITDVVLPKMGGRELARRILSTRPGTRVIYVSGYMDVGFSPFEMVEPHTAFVEKPFSARALAAKIRALLDPAPAKSTAGRPGRT